MEIVVWLSQLSPDVLTEEVEADSGIQFASVMTLLGLMNSPPDH